MKKGNLFVDFFPESPEKIVKKGKTISLEIDEWIKQNLLPNEKLNFSQAALTRLIQGSGSGKSTGFQFGYNFRLNELNFDNFLKFVSEREVELILPRIFKYIIYPSSTFKNEFRTDFLEKQKGKLVVNVSFFILKNISTINYVQNESRRLLGGFDIKNLNSLPIRVMKEVNKDEKNVFDFSASNFYLIKPTTTSLRSRAIGAQYVYTYKTKSTEKLKKCIEEIYTFMVKRTENRTETMEKGVYWSDFFVGYLIPVIM